MKSHSKHWGKCLVAHPWWELLNRLRVWRKRLNSQVSPKNGGWIIQVGEISVIHIELFIGPKILNSYPPKPSLQTHSVWPWPPNHFWEVLIDEPPVVSGGSGTACPASASSSFERRPLCQHCGQSRPWWFSPRKKRFPVTWFGYLVGKPCQ